MRIRVTMDVDVPEGVTESDLIDEWVNFETGTRADINVSNPLSEYDLQADHSDWTTV